MPFQEQPPQNNFVSLEAEPFKFSWQDIADDYALELVRKTYWQCEIDRTQNHDRRWSTHDSLYYAYVPQKVWDGTNISRSAFANPIVFDQVEAALPVINNSLFGTGPDWFQVQAEPGTSTQDSQQVQDSLNYICDHPKDEVGSTCITEFKNAIKSQLLYGNGGVITQWDPLLDRATVEWVDIRDLYVDPGLCSCSLNEARFVIRRKFISIDELKQMAKNDKRIKLPSDPVLWYFAKSVPNAPADQTKRVQEALRGIYFSPGFTDYVPLPSDQKIEVLIYYSKSRIIWVLNKEWVAYNANNPYGFIPFDFAPCYVVPGRFYAQSIADVQEHNQRYIEALLNGHLDELTLNLHPPRVMNRKDFLTPAQQRWRPGAVFAGENKDSVNLLQVQSTTANVFDDIQWMTLASEKRTGINSMGQGSIPQPSNANRTLGGIQSQQAGSNSRLSEIVSNIENFLLVPVLYKLYKITQMHAVPGQALPASSPQGEKYWVDSSVTQKKVSFRMTAASKMVTRDKLMQVVPFWMQVVSQGNLISSLQGIGQTIDMQELMRMIQDATGVSHIYTLVRPMNEQEQQAKDKPSPEIAAQQQKAQQDAQVRTQIASQKNQTELQKEQIKKQPDFWQQQIDQNKAQLEAQAKQQEIEQTRQMNEQELQQKKLIALLDIHAKHQTNQMDLAKKQADMQLATQQSEQNRTSSAMDHQLQMQQMLQQAMVQKNANEISPPEDNMGGAGGPNNSGESTQGKPNEKRPLKKRAASKTKPKAPNA